MNTRIHCSVKKAIAIFLTFYVCCFNGNIVTNAYALIEANGVPQIFEDVTDPNEMYVGGANQFPGPGPIFFDSTSLTFIVKTLPQNTVGIIRGVGVTQNQTPITVLGDVTLDINNTKGNLVTGTYYADGDNGLVRGSVNIYLRSSIFNRVTGGAEGGAGQPGEIYNIAENMNIHLLDSAVTELFCSGISQYNPANPNNTYSVSGDINVDILRSNIVTFMGVSNSGSVGGSLNVNVTDSKITNFIGVGDTAGNNALLRGDMVITLNGDTQIDSLKCLGDDAAIFGQTKLTVNKAIIKDLIMFAHKYTQGGIFTIHDGYIDNFSFGVDCAVADQRIISSINVNMTGGVINNLGVGTIVTNNHGAIIKFELDMNGGYIKDIKIASDHTTVAASRLNLSGGTIASIYFSEDSLQREIIFLPGGVSYIENLTTENLEPITLIDLTRGAKTCWGTPASPSSQNVFSLNVKNFHWAGELRLPSQTSITIDHGMFYAEGGTLAPVGLQRNYRTPILSINSQEVGEATLIVETPLNVDLDLSPDLVGVSNYPLVVVSDEFADITLFAAKNRKGLIWSNVDFDAESNTWYVNKVQVSKDYYAYSAAREASNWLRQRSISTAQSYSYNALMRKHEGIWVSAQGGYESIDVAVGSSKMPWSMANVGYSYRLPLPSDFTTSFGLALGYAQGWHRWNLANRVKNDISIGMADVYAGAAHESGAYGLITAQIAISNIKTKNPGFSTNTKWSESVPTGALELGWNYKVSPKFELTPRVQVIGELLSKHKFDLSYEAGKDTVTLKNKATLTSVVGLMSSYESTFWNMPTELQASVDWIKGITGDYASSSRIFQKTFTDKNDSDVLRLSVGANTSISENMSVGLQAFGDIGNDRGIGGQANFTYKF